MGLLHIASAAVGGPATVEVNEPSAEYSGVLLGPTLSISFKPLCRLEGSVLWLYSVIGKGKIKILHSFYLQTTKMSQCVLLSLCLPSYFSLLSNLCFLCFFEEPIVF